MTALVVLFLSWAVPTENVDGTPLDPGHIDGYQVWCQPADRDEPYRQLVKTRRLSYDPGMDQGGTCCTIRTVALYPGETRREPGPATPEICARIMRDPELEQ